MGGRRAGDAGRRPSRRAGRCDKGAVLFADLRERQVITLDPAEVAALSWAYDGTALIMGRGAG
jgi:hypothetical protein